MLQFFKKAGYKDKVRSLHNSLKNSHRSKESKEDGTVGTSLVAVPNTLCSFEAEEEDYKFENGKTQINTFCSRLSKSLPEILTDKSALDYFIQFMDAKKEVTLIKFWLEIECLYNVYCTPESLENKNDVIRDYKELINYTNNSENIDNCACSIISTSISDFEIDALSLDSSVNSTEQGLALQSPTNETKSNSNLPKMCPIVNDNCKRNLKFGECKASSLYQDLLRIYRKYLAKGMHELNYITAELKVSIESVIIDENVKLLLQYLTDAQKIVYTLLENVYVNDFLRSDFHCKHQIDVLTSGYVQLTDILYNETAFFYFMEFMEIENKRELLDFWMTAMNYKQNLMEKGDSVDYAEAQTDALIIYDKYFSLQATMPLGFSDRIRFAVEQNICQEDGKGPQSDCFDRPCWIIYNFLNRYYLPTFLQSQLFYKYLSELINSVQSSNYPVFHPPLRKTESDCSSEISCASNVTSPIQNNSDEKKQTKYGLSINGGMNIDTKQLYDPDSLWRRNKCSLSVGYVDNLGRFVTEIEPDPCRKNDKQSRLSRAVKRLVHIEQDKAKEESAWKIAEMIVRDVTSLTLGASDLPS
ncbi:PREDICTED: A-kinase anchor protein 10, mitochondrial [Ceratosolen solmsi marchali]|uniref:A-kinase anchor protein 10, mitochondrial n=1 Tax=Ceratosolen solmsi marchali TaxID=326594 RepID=A0AAJ6VIW5_9HYME|nr:PREDICTED: A-kinase anchor protein 10, mitochondrial [Ceratosolen solmsi marchali]